MFNCVVSHIVVELIFYRLASANIQERKGSRKEKSQEVYITFMKGANPSIRIVITLCKFVCLIGVIKRAKCYCYKCSGFETVRLNFMLPNGIKAFLNTLLRNVVLTGDTYTKLH